jgi:hypothetical protein
MKPSEVGGAELTATATQPASRPRKSADFLGKTDFLGKALGDALLPFLPRVVDDGADRADPHFVGRKWAEHRQELVAVLTFGIKPEVVFFVGQNHVANGRQVELRRRPAPPIRQITP